MHPYPTRLQSVIVWVCLSLAILLFAAVGVFAVVKSRPIEITETYRGAEITYSANHEWVLFPRECVEVTWTVKNAVSTTFYPMIQPGIKGGAGTRTIFMARRYQPGLATTENATGGVTENITDSQPQTRTQTACLDFTTEPKLRVLFQDGTSKSYKLGLDVLFLRLDVWGMVIVAIGLVFAASAIRRHPRFSLAHLSVWVSTAFLTLYAIAFFRQLEFIKAYTLDAVIFFALWGGFMTLTVYSIRSPQSFVNRVVNALGSGKTRFSVVLFWVWVLSFGYFNPNTTLMGEFFWMPFFLWAFLIGMGVLWQARPPALITPQPLNAVTSCLKVAFFFAGVVFIRDVLFFKTYSIILSHDTASYLVEAVNFMNPGSSIGIPKRIFPYLLMNYLAQSSVNPVPLLTLQFALSALATGMMTYVLARKHIALGITIGILFTLNFGWSTYNRIILTESAFISFNVISLAAILWHAQRKAHLPYWELVLFGVLYGWTLLFRGTGLPLILPILVIYWVITRTWFKPMAVLAGYLILLGGVGVYNQWRYGEFGLVGAQTDTFASSLFSYNLFSPQNGSTSQAFDTALRDCMGYLDYDDVPRAASHFIFGHLNPCVLPVFGREAVTDMTSAALRELITHRPFDFARVLIQEVGIGLQLPVSYEFPLRAYEEAASEGLSGVCLRQFEWCTDFLRETNPPQNDVLLAINRLANYPSQLYLAIEQTSSATPAVMLFAFLMLSGFLWVVTREKLLVLACSGLILYQLLTVAIAHTFFPRYGLILVPFIGLLSGLALWNIIPFGSRLFTRPKRYGILISLLMLGYLAWSNPTLRQTFSAPVAARLGVNLFQKYGITTTDFEVYRVMSQDSITAFNPATNPINTQALDSLGVVRHGFDLTPYEQERLVGWNFTHLPGYMRDLGVTHLLFDDKTWLMLSPEAQAILNDEKHYHLVGIWGEQPDTRRLYEVVGDTRGSYRVYEGNQVILFEQPDRALDLYHLDSNRNGIFALRIPYGAEISDTAVYTGETGWLVRFKATNEAKDSYWMIIYDPSGQEMDNGYEVKLR